jgi:hypothetical protein
MEGSAISEASLKAAITERLNAVHVEITDMSGSCSKWLILNAVPHFKRIMLFRAISQRLRSLLTKTRLQEDVARHFRH